MKLVIQIRRRNRNFKGQRSLGAKKFMSDKHEKIMRQCTIDYDVHMSQQLCFTRKTIITIHLQ